MAWRNIRSLCSFGKFGSVFRRQRGEVELGAYTIQSHGASLAWNHKHDWIILVLLAVIEVILFVIHPFYRFVGKDMMADLQYPLKDNTVPVWAVPMIAVVLPIVVFVLIYLRRRDVYDLHHSVLGLLFAVLITAVITDAIKDGVGRPRPDFFYRCFPDGRDWAAGDRLGVALGSYVWCKCSYRAPEDRYINNSYVYNQLGGVVCHGEASVIKEGHKSFPSGHTSWSFAGLGFLSLYLAGKIQVFDRRGHIAKLCIVFFPLLVAALIGVSRVNDYWHHWQDVFAGGVLGLVVATFCYRQFFPNPYDDNGWGPYAYFRALEESRADPNTGEQMNALNAQATGIQQGRRNGNPPATIGGVLSLTMDDMESGRR